MKIQDCKIGMKVRNCYKGEIEKEEDKQGTISKVNIEDGDFEMENTEGTFYPRYFEPVNNFQVGDKVVVKEFTTKAEVRGFKKNGKPIIETESGYVYSSEFNELSPFKKPDELEKGDKFIYKPSPSQKYIIIVLGSFYEKGEKFYVGRRKSDNWRGIYPVIEVDEIIYD